MNVFDIGSFLGMDGYYRRFVEGFSRLAAPLTALTHKGTCFEWTEEYEKSSVELKTCLTSAPILRLPQEGVMFEVYCDASGVELGSVLMLEH